MTSAGSDEEGLCSITAADVQKATPCKLAGALLRLSKPFLRAKVARAVADVPLEPAKEKLQEGVDKLVDEVSGRLEDASCKIGDLDLNVHVGKLAVEFWKLRLPSLGGSLGWPDFKFPSLSFDFLFGKLGFFDFDLPSFDIGKFFLNWDFKLWLPKLSLALGTFSFGDLSLDINIGGLLWGILNAIRLWLPRCNVDLSKKIGEAVRPLMKAVLEKLPDKVRSAVGPKLDALVSENLDNLTLRDAIRKAVKAIFAELVKDERRRVFYLAAFEVLLAGFCNDGKLMNDAAAKKKLGDLFVSMLDLLWAQARFESPTVKKVSDALFAELRRLVAALFSQSPPKNAKQWVSERLSIVRQELFGHLAGQSSPFNSLPDPFRGLAKSLIPRVAAWLSDPKALGALGKSAGCSGAIQVVKGLLGDGATNLGAPAVLQRVIDAAKDESVCKLAKPSAFANLFLKALLETIVGTGNSFVQQLVRGAVFGVPGAE